MRSYTKAFALQVGLAVAFAGAAAWAHIVPETAPVFANTTTIITFAIEHGCSGKDTVALKADIPSGITGVRAMFSDFAKPTATVDNSSNVTSFTWTKPDGELLDGLGGSTTTNDYAYYRITLRFKTPNSPFTTLYMPFHQTCRDPSGATAAVDWTDTSSGAANPPPGIKLFPPRVPGWNKFTVPAAMTSADLTSWFSDAQIVWKGTTAAFSANPNVAAQISGSSGVTTLTSLNANDEIWVKY
jgi:periplasmic copper chaperone A